MGLYVNAYYANKVMQRISKYFQLVGFGWRGVIWFFDGVGEREEGPGI